MPGFGQVTFFFSFNHSQKWNPKLQIEESGFPYRFSKGRNIARHLQFTLVFSFWNAALLLLLVALYHTNSSTISRISFPPPPFIHTLLSANPKHVFSYISEVYSGDSDGDTCCSGLSGSFMVIYWKDSRCPRHPMVAGEGRMPLAFL